jgi:orotate phosphoribosyltransferase
METYKQEFIEFMVRSGALTFGDFTTKSGRKTPYFINTGNYDTGRQMERLGYFYSEAIRATLGDAFDNLYGPAYKGIPLCVTTAIALAREFDRDVTFTFNRKEAKDHGEGGALIGYRYGGGERVVIVEDVMTAGTSVRESTAILQAAAPKENSIELTAVIVSVDRMERGVGEKSALAEVAEEFGLHTFAIVTIDEIVEYLQGREIDGRVVIDEETMARIHDYRARYGAAQQ